MGLVFTDVDDVLLAGIDLDSCRDPDSGAIAVWAQEVIDRFDTYTEVSPSGTGAKVFFAIARADLAEVEAIFGGACGRLFKNGGGGDHPPAIEVYYTKRYFATTDEAIGPTDELWRVSVADLRWLVCEAGPRFAGKAAKSESGAGKDESRSAKAFRKGAALKAAGASYQEMRDALLEDADPEISAWAPRAWRMASANFIGFTIGDGEALPRDRGHDRRPRGRRSVIGRPAPAYPAMRHAVR